MIRDAHRFVLRICRLHSIPRIEHRKETILRDLNVLDEIPVSPAGSILLTMQADSRGEEVVDSGGAKIAGEPSPAHGIVRLDFDCLLKVLTLTPT